MAINYALNMFFRHGIRIASLKFVSWLCITCPTSSHSHMSPTFFGGLKDPSV